MHAVEQAVAEQVVHLAPNSGSAAGDTNSTAPLRAMPRDDVGHVARQQPIAVFLGIEQPEARARERFGAEREAGGIERGRNDAERRQRRLLVLDRHRRRQQIRDCP